MSAHAEAREDARVEDALRERIKELEALLETAVYVKAEEWQKVANVLGLSRTRAVVLVGLYRAEAKAGLGLTYEELATLIPNDWTNSRRLDSEFRTINCVKAVLAELRRRAPGFLVPNRGDRWRGVRLTEEGRRLVGEALGA